MSQYLTETIDSSICIRFTLAKVNGRTERTTEMMQMYSNVIFVQKYACDQKIIHSTGCSLAGVTCDSSISVQFKTICDA